VLNNGWFSRAPEELPIIYGRTVAPLARNFFYILSSARTRFAGKRDLKEYRSRRVVRRLVFHFVMSGLAAIVAPVEIVQLRRQRLLLRSGGRDRTTRARP